MKVISTNIAEAKTIEWNGEKMKTGIFKFPVAGGVYLERSDVKNDSVVDRFNHGGVYKACYMYSTDHYGYWKSLYPSLDWQFGMFGENLSVEGLDEKKLIVGSIYKVGEALVQVSEPRQPCFKFGVKMGDANAIRQMLESKFSGSYLKVLESGWVRGSDTFELMEEDSIGVTTYDVFNAIFYKTDDLALINKIIKHDHLPMTCIDSVKDKQKFRG